MIAGYPQFTMATKNLGIYHQRSFSFEKKQDYYI